MIGPIYTATLTGKLIIDLKVLAGAVNASCPNISIQKLISGFYFEDDLLNFNNFISFGEEIGIRLKYCVFTKILLNFNIDYFHLSPQFKYTETTTYAGNPPVFAQRISSVSCPISLLNVTFGLGYKF